MAARLVVLLAVILLAIPGFPVFASTRGAPTIAAHTVSGLHSRTRSLSTAALSKDALHPGQLASVLRHADYLGGSEREFFGRSPTFTHVIARILLFGSARGADAYLAWLRSHADDILGSSKRERPLPIGTSPLLFSLVGCGCHGEFPTYLAGWSRGREVFWLLAAGPGDSRSRFTTLARSLDGQGS